MAGAEPLQLKHANTAPNGLKCQMLGWTCIPLAVETFGNWGNEAQDVVTRLASHLPVSVSIPNASTLADSIYGNTVIYTLI